MTCIHFIIVFCRGVNPFLILQCKQTECLRKVSAGVQGAGPVPGITRVLTRVKGTNGRQKTYEIFHVHCIFYSGFMCQTTVIFGITKDGSLVLNTLAS